MPELQDLLNGLLGEKVLTKQGLVDILVHLLYDIILVDFVIHVSIEVVTAVKILKVGCC